MERRKLSRLYWIFILYLLNSIYTILWIKYVKVLRITTICSWFLKCRVLNFIHSLFLNFKFLYFCISAFSLLSSLLCIDRYSLDEVYEVYDTQCMFIHSLNRFCFFCYIFFFTCKRCHEIPDRPTHNHVVEEGWNRFLTI